MHDVDVHLRGKRMKQHAMLSILITLALLVLGEQSAFADLSAQDQSGSSIKLDVQAVISLDIQDASLHQVLGIFAEAMKTNIVTYQGVTGRVRELRLRDVPTEQAFQLILRLHDLYAVKEGNVIIVYPLETNPSSR